jgi:hypothetical protein
VNGRFRASRDGRELTGWRRITGSRIRAPRGTRLLTGPSKAVAAFVPHFATAVQKRSRSAELIPQHSASPHAAAFASSIAGPMIVRATWRAAGKLILGFKEMDS